MTETGTVTEQKVTKRCKQFTIKMYISDNFMHLQVMHEKLFSYDMQHIKRSIYDLAFMFFKGPVFKHLKRSIGRKWN